MTDGISSSTADAGNRDGIKQLAAGAGLALTIAGLFALALLAGSGLAGAQPAEDPLVNETVNVTDPANESVYVDAEFTENDTVEVYAFNDSTGAEIGNTSITGTAGEMASHSFAVEHTGEHRVEIYGNESAVDQAWVSTDEGTEGTPVFGGSDDGDDGGMSVGAVELMGLIAALFVILGLVARGR